MEGDKGQKLEFKFWYIEDGQGHREVANMPEGQGIAYPNPKPIEPKWNPQHINYEFPLSL